MTTLNVWGQLWDIATRDCGPSGPWRPALIVPGYDDGHVTLVWPDGTREGLARNDGKWQPSSVHIDATGRLVKSTS